jgi:hypothetical protein
MATTIQQGFLKMKQNLEITGLQAATVPASNPLLGCACLAANAIPGFCVASLLGGFLLCACCLAPSFHRSGSTSALDCRLPKFIRLRDGSPYLV